MELGNRLRRNLVEIVWRDTWSSHSVWTEADQWKEEDLLKKMTMMSVGYIIKKTKRIMWICADISGQDSRQGRIQSFPLGCIISIRKIAPGGFTPRTEVTKIQKAGFRRTK